jgi:capsular exopolysaccharide synthesis family protein
VIASKRRPNIFFNRKIDTQSDLGSTGREVMYTNRHEIEIESEKRNGTAAHSPKGGRADLVSMELARPSPYRSPDDTLIAAQVVLARANFVDADEKIQLAAENYRLLCTRVFQVARSLKSKVFLITSAVPAEGKTLTAMNLGFGLSRVEGKRTLLVELDLRHPSMHRLLGIRRSETDMTFLEQPGDWREGMWALRPNLHALLAMNASLRPDELLHSERFQDFLTEARKEYDFIIIDSAPLLAAADTHALIPMVDQALFVLRANSTPINCAQDALEILGKKTLGCVLNDVEELKYHEYYGQYVVSRKRP